MAQPPDQTAIKPRKSAQQARSAATVGVIVEAAARILETAGLAGYTTNAIAERAGVSVGSLYQYFLNKDAITRALIRRELEALDAAVEAIDPGPAALARFVAIAVGRQMHRPVLAQSLEVEEERLGAGGDIDPVRRRVGAVLSAILTAEEHADDAAVVQDVMAVIAALVNAAATRGERGEHLALRIERVVRARLATG